MHTTTTVTFYGAGEASRDFLQAHHLYYHSTSGNYSLLAERNEAGQVRVYLFSFAGSLRLLQESLLTKLGLAGGSRDEQDRLPLDMLDSMLASNAEAYQWVFRDDDPNRPGLRNRSLEEVMKHGVTKQTARWFSRLLEQAFTPMTAGTVYSEEGVELDTAGFYVEADTLKRQLKKLQQANALTARPTADGGVQVKFNRSMLVGIEHAIVPSFFEAMLY